MIKVNEAGYQVTKQSLYQRLRFLWRVIQYVVKPTVYIDIHREVDQFGRIVVSGWIKKPGEKDFKYHYVNYDGKTAPTGFIDGKQIEEPSAKIISIGRTIKHEQIKSRGSSYELEVWDCADQDEQRS